MVESTNSVHAGLECLVEDRGDEDVGVGLGLLDKFIARGNVQRDLALNGLVASVAGDVDKSAFLERSDNGVVVPETTHTLEVGDELEGDGGVVFGDELPEEFVERQVRVREIEFDLEENCQSQAGGGRGEGWG